jgi:hypothetical protein
MTTQLFRYDYPQSSTSMREPLIGIFTWVKSMRSRAYAEDVIREKHAMTRSALRTVQARAEAARAHIILACDFIDQALGGHETVSFLPLYYGLLNLAKTIVLLGPYADQLRAQPRHGVSLVPPKLSPDLFTDTIQLWQNGAISLFYKTIVGAPPPAAPSQNHLNVRLGDVYPYISDIGAEYTFAAGNRSRLRDTRVEARPIGGAHRVVATVDSRVDISPGGSGRRYLPLVKGLKREAAPRETQSERYVSGRRWSRSGDGPIDALKNCFPSHLLYVPRMKVVQDTEIWVCRTPVTNKSLQLFEELPIVLAMFHIGSIVRYHPETHLRLMDSRYWPMLLALRNDAAAKFMLLFWSYVHQAHFMIE